MTCSLPRRWLIAAALLILASTAGAQPDAPAKVDCYGDPLPPGAVARLGNNRFRSPDWLRSLSFTLDGKCLIGGSYKGTCVWDAATGRLARRLGMELSDSLATTAVSRDGKLVAIGGRDKDNCAIYEIASGRRVCFYGRGYEVVDPICFSPDGKTLVAKVWLEDELLLFDAATGQPSTDWKAGKVFAAAVSFTSDGKGLITGDRGGAISLRDPKSGKVQRQIVRTPDGVYRMIPSPDASRLVTVGNTEGGMGLMFNFPTNHPNNRVHFWDVKSGKEIRQLRVPTDKEVEDSGASLDGLAFDPDGKRVWTIVTKVHVTPSERKELRSILQIWDWESGKEVQRFSDFSGTAGPVTFAPDGKSFALVESENVVHLRDRTSGRDLQPAVGHRGKVEIVEVSPDGRLAATTGDDHAICLWELPTGRFLRRLQGHKERVLRLVYQDNNQTLLSIGEDESLRTWDIATGQERRRVGTSLFGGAFSQDGRLRCWRSADTLCVRDLAANKTIHEFTVPFSFLIRTAFSPKGRTLYAWSSEPPILYQWDLQTGKGSKRPCSALKDFVPIAIYFSPDGRRSALVLSSSRIDVVDHATAHVVRSITDLASDSLSGNLWPLAFSPDGRTLACCVGEDSAIYLVEIATGQVRHRLRGHGNDVRHAVFCPDGRQLISTSMDATALVWDVTQIPGMERRPLSPEDLASCWADLQHPDAIRAYKDQLRMRQEPGRAVAELARRLRPVPSMDENQIVRRITDLDSDQFAVRERAAMESAQVVELAEPVLRRALQNRPSLEMRRRVQALLDQLDVSRSPERLRQLRAVEVLEAIGTSEARQLLRKLADGEPAALQTREAKESLDRLARRQAGQP